MSLLNRFPLKNESLLAAWIKAISRKDWIPGKYDYICSEHFTTELFSEKLGTKSRRLKPDAVPNIFPRFPSYMQVPEKPTQKSPRKHLFQDAAVSTQASPTKVRKVISQDHAYSYDSHKPAETSKEISTLRNEMQILKQKLKR